MNDIRFNVFVDGSDTRISEVKKWGSVLLIPENSDLHESRGWGTLVTKENLVVGVDTVQSLIDTGDIQITKLYGFLFIPEIQQFTVEL